MRYRRGAVAGLAFETVDGLEREQPRHGSFVCGHHSMTRDSQRNDSHNASPIKRRPTANNRPSLNNAMSRPVPTIPPQILGVNCGGGRCDDRLIVV